MSLKMMLSAMETTVGDKTAKLVLIKLADNANEKGECWPSYETIAKVCECSVKTAQRKVALLEEKGFIEKTLRKGDKGNQSNLYKLFPSAKGRQNDQSRETECRKGGDKLAQGGGDKLSSMRGDSLTPESVSIEPVITESVIETIEREKIVSLESLNAFVSYRKKIKKPMTTHAVELLVEKLGGLRVDGHSPQELINDAIMNGWQSVYPKTSAQTNRTFQSHQERIREENMRVMSNWANKE